jgi:hypothetical protein
MTTKSPPQVILQMLTGSWVCQALYVAAKLRIADLVKDQPKTSAELAQATATHAPSLYRLLRMLASVGVFVEDDRARFGTTELAQCLVDAPGSQRAAALMMGEEHFRCWGELEYSIRTGKTAFDHIFGQPIFDYLSEHPDKAKIFDAAMVGIHGAETQAMLDAYEFASFGTLVDVGGGNGSVLCATLKRYPALRGILYDLPGVIERATETIAQAGLAGRCQARGGSFFESVPSGGDAYVMRHIIHDWTDEQSLTILRHCRKAMAAAGRLLLVESVIPPGNEPSFAKQLDVNMLLIPGGKERTQAEYEALYQAAGFRLTRVVPTRMEISIIEGMPA